MSKQPRPGSPEWAAAHPDKMGGRRRGTRKGRKGSKSRKGRKGGKSRRRH